MRELQRFIIALLAVVVTMGVSILTMIKGWGLEPVNWWYIVPFYFFGSCVGLLLATLAKRE